MMDKEFIDKYEQATVESIRKMDDLLRNRNIYEIYFGGGTPSLWSYKNESKIPQLLSSYNRIHRRITEVHPSDLNSERINFIANTMKFNIVSIGIQSFDYDSNISQHRIPVDINKLSRAVDELRSSGVFINMDIVAMFNGDDARNWEIYKNDLQIAAEIFHPDTLSTSPNYKSSDYYGISIKFREILKDFHNKYPEYLNDYGDLLYSQNYEDIINFNGATYKFHLKEYADKMIAPSLLNGTIDQHSTLNKDIVIGFGGYKNSRALSRTPENTVIRSYYDPISDTFVNIRKDEDMFGYMKESDIYNKQIKIGSYVVPPPMKRE